MGTRKLSLKERMALVSRTTKTTNAALSKSVSCACDTHTHTLTEQQCIHGTNLKWSELYSPANGRVWWRRLETHTLPVGGLNILRESEIQREGGRERERGGRREGEGESERGREREGGRGREGEGERERGREREGGRGREGEGESERGVYIILEVVWKLTSKWSVSSSVF